MKGFLSAADFLKKVEADELEGLTEDEIKEGIVGATEMIDKVLARVLGESSEWDNLKEKLEKGIIDSILTSENEFLKDKDSIDAIKGFIQDLFGSWQKDITNKIYQSNRKNVPSIEGRFEQVRKRAMSYDPENIRDSLKQYMSQGNDPFGISQIREHLDEILKKSKIEYETTDDIDASLKDIITKNLSEVDLPNIFTRTFSAYIVDHMDDTADDLFLEMENVFKAVEDELEKILLIEKLGSSFKDVLEMIESFNELTTTPQSEETLDPEINRNVTIDFDFDKYFKEAKDHRWDLLQALGQGIDNIYFKLEQIWGDLAGTLTNLRVDINRIHVPEQYPATISQKKGG